MLPRDSSPCYRRERAAKRYGNYPDDPAATAHVIRVEDMVPSQKIKNRDDIVCSQTKNLFGALLYQGTGPHCEFNGLIIVSRTVAVVKHSNSSSKKLPGKNQSRNSPAVLPHVSLSICETIW